MNGTVAGLHAQLVAACSDVPGVRLHEPGQPLSAPGVAVLPPRLRFEDAGTAPNAGRWQVVVFVDLDERAAETLFALLEPVAQAIALVPDAVVVSADPGVFGSNRNEQFPSYTFEIEV